jgi:hypothetical protein
MIEVAVVLGGFGITAVLVNEIRLERRINRHDQELQQLVADTAYIRQRLDVLVAAVLDALQRRALQRDTKGQ